MGAVLSLDETTVFATTPYNNVFKSLDAGITWENSVIFPTTELMLANDLFLASAQDVWACGYDVTAQMNNFKGFIAHSQDGGQTWENVVENDEFTYDNIGFYGDFGWASSYYLWGLEPKMKITEDGGATWSDLPLPVNPYLAFFIDNQNGWCLEGSTNNYKTNDGGATWTSITIPNPPYIGFLSHCCLENVGVWAIGFTYGEYFLYRMLLNPTSSKEISKDQSNLMLAPNPFTTEFTIQISEAVNTSDKLIISLLNTEGKQVFSREERSVTPGGTITITPPTQLPKGTYIMKVSTGEMVYTKTIVKQ